MMIRSPKHPRLDDSADAHIAPALRLPFEIISEIFLLASPTSRLIPTQYPVDVRPHQALVGSICRYWREVAHSTPKLWKIVIVHVPDAQSQMTPFLDILQKRLDYSGTQDVQVWIYGSGRLGFSQIISLIAIHYIHRVKSLKAFINSPFPITQITPLQSPSLQIASHEVITFMVHRQKAEVVDEFRRMEIAVPSGEVPFKISKIHYPTLRKAAFYIPWHSLDSRHLNAFIQKHAALESLELDISKFRKTYDIRSESLTFLSIRFKSPANIPELSHLPNLKHLRLSFQLDVMNMTPLASSNGSSLSASLPSVQSFVIDTAAPYEEEIERLLSKMVNLVALEISAIALQCWSPEEWGAKLRILRLTPDLSWGPSEYPTLIADLMNKRPNVTVEWAADYLPLGFPDGVIHREKGDSDWFVTPLLSDLVEEMVISSS